MANTVSFGWKLLEMSLIVVLSAVRLLPTCASTVSRAVGVASTSRVPLHDPATPASTARANM